MSKKRRVIRKTEPVRVQRVADQLWALAVALCILGGFLAGTVLAYLRFDDPRWYANAWTYLIAIPVVVASSLIALAATGNRLLRRSMQLALVLGILFHLLLFIMALETDVFRRVWVEVLATQQSAPQREVVKVPQYTWEDEARRRAQREFDEPVETDLPDPDLETPVREMPSRAPSEVSRETAATPESQSTVHPNVAERKRVNESVPRQRDRRSQLSRRRSQRSTDPVQPVPVPERPRRSRTAGKNPQPRDWQLPRQAQSQHAQRSPGPAPKASPRPEDTLPAARRKMEIAAAESEAAVRMPRRKPAAGIAPRSDVQVGDQPAIARESRPEQIEPNNTAARKQRTELVERREPVQLPVQSRADESVTRRRRAQSPPPRQPALARTPQSVENRRPRVTSRPDLAAQAESAPRQVTRSRDAQSGSAEPRQLSVARSARSTASQVAPDRPATPSAKMTPRPARSNRPRAVVNATRPETAEVNAKLPSRQPAPAPQLGTVAQRASPVARQPSAQEAVEPAPRAVAATRANVPERAPGNSPAEAVRRSVPLEGDAPTAQRPRRRRRPADARPAVAAQPRDARAPRRSVSVAQEPRSPIAAESPAPVVENPQTQPAAARPSSLALSKAQSGMAGQGASRNLDTDAASPSSPATVASGSAHRAEATQQVPAGPALSPQAPALVRHGRAAQRRPTAALQATPLSPAALPGSREPEALTADASAALTESASNAQRGKITASKGTLEVDLGPTTTISQSGVGRASGGGQPRRSSGLDVRSVTRSALQRAASSSLLADQVSPKAAAPPRDGGGEPRPVELDDQPNAALHARVSSERGELGGPTAAGGGEADLPTRSLTAASRRAATASDGPPLARPSESTPLAGRKASRDRQVESPSGPIELSAGNAQAAEDAKAPGSLIAADAAGVELGKQADESVRAEPAAAKVAAPGQNAAGDGVLALRAEAAEAVQGPPEVGGGTGSPSRRPLSPPLAVDRQAAEASVAGAEQSSGRKEAEPQSTQGTLLTRRATGLDAPSSEMRVGAVEPEHSGDGDDAVVPGPSSWGRSRAQTESASPQGAKQQMSGRFPRRAQSLSPGPPVPAVAVPGEAQETLAAPAEDAPGALEGSLARQGAAERMAGAALPVEIEMPEGPGGLGPQPSVEVGVPDRRASETSEQIQLKTARFVRREVGGVPDLNPSAAVAAEPFRRRDRREQTSGDPVSGAGPETEEAIELGLVFLSRMQTADGRWTLDCLAQEDGLPQLSSDTAATGLALLAFQGAGYNHRQYRYAEQVRGGVDFLVHSQKDDGDLYVSMDDESNRVVALYSHSIAALALCEAYGMTQDPELRNPAQKALDFIVATQHPERGGWRYTPGVGSDTSVTGWMMMALKSGDLANLEVPDDTYQQIRQWLERAEYSDAQPHLYCYNPYAPDTPQQRRGRRPTPPMTSVGLLMRLYSGWRRDDPNMARGADYLMDTPPAIGSTTNPQRDTYYWYYATQVMFHMGGQYWSAWNERLHPLLVNSQVREGDLAGSWDPLNPVPDRWAPFAGRLYVTTMNLLSLEVTYRYLPLYEDTAE